MTQYMTSGRLKLAEHARQTHVATIPQGVSLETALDPVFWTHVAHQVRPRDRVELWAEDRAWFADTVVVSASRLKVELQVLAKLKLDAAPVVALAVAASGYHIDFGGGVDLWRVIRNADSQVMASGMSQAEAQTWMHDHIAAQSVAVSVPAPEVAPSKPTAMSPALETPETRAAVEIPEGWADLSWQERRSIASKLTEDAIHNGQEANAAIEAELARRTQKAA